MKVMHRRVVVCWKMHHRHAQRLTPQSYLVAQHRERQLEGVGEHVAEELLHHLLPSQHRVAPVVRHPVGTLGPSCSCRRHARCHKLLQLFVRPSVLYHVGRLTAGAVSSAVLTIISIDPEMHTRHQHVPYHQGLSYIRAGKSTPWHHWLARHVCSPHLSTSIATWWLPLSDDAGRNLLVELGMCVACWIAPPLASLSVVTHTCKLNALLCRSTPRAAAVYIQPQRHARTLFVDADVFALQSPVQCVRPGWSGRPFPEEASIALRFRRSAFHTMRPTSVCLHLQSGTLF